jgi:hypothetical protein
MISNKEYLENPHECPYCKSRLIESDGYGDLDGDEYYNKILCNNCDERWTEVYKLTHVLEVQK